MSNQFVFIVPAFNCENTIQQTIMSVVAQSYKNWRLIVYDDMSTDSTVSVVETLAHQLLLENKIEVVSRNEKFGEVRNTLDAIESIDDEEIICRLDGGDWLVDNDILHIINQAYENLDPAVLWTAHRWSYTGKNISGPFEEGTIDVYKHPWVSSHLKTFRRSAMRGINPKNYLDDEGNFIMIACDQAIFLPMMQKAIETKRSLAFLPLVGYHYNIDLDNPELFTCDRSQKQKVSAEWIRERGYIR